VGGVKAGDLALESSIIANNSVTTAGGAADLLITSTWSGANNLVMLSNGASVPPGTLTADPNLCPLANHGGATRTHALLSSSPVIAMGNNPGFPPASYDQRGPGYQRTDVSGLSSWTDIGAYQVQLTNEDEIFCDGNGPLPDR
jgi:hypothetical protein